MCIQTHTYKITHNHVDTNTNLQNYTQLCAYKHKLTKLHTTMSSCLLEAVHVPPPFASFPRFLCHPARSPSSGISVMKRCAGLSTCILPILSERLYRNGVLRTHVGVNSPGKRVGDSFDHEKYREVNQCLR
uniref:Calcitonin peptide-like domain-containing protein n=1 Tax=Eptatretus burgeri TaxID=7764 RepID=A0A8C4N3Q3_EPTBU